MQKKIIKYSLSILAVLFLAFNSVYFKKLDEVKLAASKGFDARSYARNFYDKRLLPHVDSAVEINRLVSLLKKSPEQAFKEYSNALGIGNIRYFLVKGQATISSIEEDAIKLNSNDSIKNDIKIATEFVYGNAIRDASGLINLNDFTNTADFNSVSEEVNKIVRKDMLPPIKSVAKPGNEIKFSGAIELNQKHLNLDSIEIIPIQIFILK